MYLMSDKEFERAIEEALDAMPPQFLEALENVAVVWEEEPSAYHLGYDEDGWDDGFEDDEAWENGEAQGAGSEDMGDAGPDDGAPDDLLGLFDGLSIVERANGYDDDIPDVITVFKGPHERCFNNREEIVEEIGKTIIHELGHYFGLNEDQLAAMGYE